MKTLMIATVVVWLGGCGPYWYRPPEAWRHAAAGDIEFIRDTAECETKAALAAAAYADRLFPSLVQSWALKAVFDQCMQGRGYYRSRSESPTPAPAVARQG
jgi:hypothetical protein